MKAGGVLIYPDPKDYQLNGDVAMFGHVSMVALQLNVQLNLHFCFDCGNAQ